MGGIHFYLEKDLIDPTFKIKENGVWQTLAYPRGYYHLNGIQAMRIIRSRATSSDFERSYRQQLILQALFQKLKQKCGENLETALKITTLLLNYVQTNLSPLEAAIYFFQFKDFHLSSPHIIDTSNILQHTWSNLLSLDDDEKEKLLTEAKINEEGEDQSKLGLWILVPKNNDWDLLRAYIRTILSSP